MLSTIILIIKLYPRSIEDQKHKHKNHAQRICRTEFYYIFLFNKNCGLLNAATSRDLNVNSTACTLILTHWGQERARQADLVVEEGLPLRKNGLIVREKLQVCIVEVGRVVKKHNMTAKAPKFFLLLFMDLNN